MATVIDSLIVELGLDPKNFAKGKKEAAKDLLDLKDDANKRLGEIEHSVKGFGETLSKVKGGLLGLFATLVGGYGIKEFAQKITEVNSETGRTANLFNMSTRALSAWRGATAQFGGSADGMTSSIQGVVSGIQDFALTGQSTLIPVIRGLQGKFPDLNLSLTDTNGKMRDMTEWLLEISEALHRLPPETAAAFGSRLGFDHGTINLLIKGKTAVTGLLEEQKKLGIITEEDSAASQRLETSMKRTEQAATGLGRSIMNSLTPALSISLDLMTKALDFFKRLKTGEGFSAQDFADMSAGGFSVPDSGGSGSPPAQSKGPESGIIGGISAALRSAAVEGYIREAAAKRGINPDVAVAVARSEGLNKYVGDQGTSFGPFQLHYKNNIPGLSNPGLGDEFTRKTGLHASDPSTVKDQIDFALDQAKQGGWSPWHGYKGPPRAGLPAYGAGVAASSIDRSSSSSSSSETHIGSISVDARGADADGIARGLRPAIERSNLGAQANSGMN